MYPPSIVEEKKEEKWTNLCATASGLPFGGSRPVEAQVQWLVLDLSSTSPSNVLHKNTPRILSQRLMMGPTVAEESLQIRKPMQ